VIRLSVAEIARITEARLDQVTDPEAVVTGPAVIDSRRAQPGSLFAALPGERADGHDFAGAARDAGAAAVLASRPVGAAGVPTLIVTDVAAALARLARYAANRLSGAPTGLTVIGITGSAGKTTTKDLTAQLVERLGPTVAPEGSFNNEIGHPLTVLRADEQTRYLVLELSARGPGHIAALCEIAPPRLGAVLNVGRAHLGEFRTRDAIAEAKGELVEALPADGTAMLNADDPLTAAMAARTAAHVVTFGRSAGADVRAEDVRCDAHGRPVFTLVTASSPSPARAQVRLNFRGEHNVSNALAAAALAAELGMDTAAVADALRSAAPRSKWRMEVADRADGVTVINDAYNASPEAMASALRTLAVMAQGAADPGPNGHARGDPPPRRRSFAVLGGMAELGEHSAGLHREAGALAALAGVTGLIVVGDTAAPMLDGAKAQRDWHGELVHVPDPAAAVEALAQRLQPGDVVLVKASRAAGLERVALALLDGGTS
jgi:UDP-N-acetylmuramoyl-tripeptide--D-alanyl-D-alanine ligase